MMMDDLPASSYTFTGLLAVPVEDRLRLSKAAREGLLRNVQRPKFQGSMILHSHFKKHRCKCLHLLAGVG